MFLGLDLAAHLLHRHRGQISAWKRAGVKIHLVVYDLLPVRQPQWFQRKTVRNFNRWLRFLGRYCDNAICISHHTLLDLQSWLHCHAPARTAAISTQTIRLGGDLAATGPSQGISEEIASLLTQQAARSFVLMIGTIEPRKGYEIAIQGFERLWARDGNLAPDLVLVGRPGWKTDALQQHIRSHVSASQKLFWLDNASDEVLDRLYRDCWGVIVPAYAEGFGLPVDEASRYGKPVLARDLAVFREAGRPAISFFHDDIGFPDALSCWIKTLPRTDVPAVEPCSWDVTYADLVCALGVNHAVGCGDDQ
jgi:glycosyltransferase involved in cell wall biosynthesis